MDAYVAHVTHVMKGLPFIIRIYLLMEDPLIIALTCMTEASNNIMRIRNKILILDLCVGFME